MASTVVAEPVDDESTPTPEAEEPRARRRRRWKVLAGVGATVLVLLVVALLWFFLGREQADPLSDDQALADFRASSADSSDSDGRPAAGVYAATASGNESIGLPGFDERLGPNAPVTVTHGDGGCYTYRADFNSHHWRSWTFCPTDGATFSLTELVSWTARKAPGLDLETRSTYTCERPLDFLWQGAAVGDTRAGACTGTSDMDDSVVADEARTEVLDVSTMTVGGESFDVVNVATNDDFSGDQTGSEVGKWWLDAATGLPVKVEIEASLKGGASDYAETIELELSTLTPAT